MTKKVRNGLKKVVSIVMTSALIVGMTTVGTGGKMVADAAPTATNTRTWEFSKNEGKPMPVKGEILPDTDKGRFFSYFHQHIFFHCRHVFHGVPFHGCL